MATIIHRGRSSVAVWVVFARMCGRIINRTLIGHKTTGAAKAMTPPPLAGAQQWPSSSSYREQASWWCGRFLGVSRSPACSVSFGVNNHPFYFAPPRQHAAGFCCLYDIWQSLNHSWRDREDSNHPAKGTVVTAWSSGPGGR